MRNLKFQSAKDAKPYTNSKSLILEEYYDLLDIFSNNDSNRLFPIKNINIIWYSNHISLYKKSYQEFDKIKCYLNSHFAIRFIQSYSSVYSSPIFCIKKTVEEVQFCVNY